MRTIEYQVDGSDTWTAIQLPSETGNHMLIDIRDAIQATGAFDVPVEDIGTGLSIGLVHGGAVEGPVMVIGSTRPFGKWRGVGDFTTIPKQLSDAWRRMLGIDSVDSDGSTP